MISESGGRKILGLNDRFTPWCLHLVNRVWHGWLGVMIALLVILARADASSASVRQRQITSKPSKGGVGRHGRRVQAQVVRASTAKQHLRHGHEVVQYSGTKKTVTHLTGHHIRHHNRMLEAAKHAKTKYAYPLGFFLFNPPAFDQSGFPSELNSSIKGAFMQGLADGYPPRSLVKAGVITYHPLRGGIFWRRESIKYVIIHSTETGIPLSAVRVIESWNSMGRRHPGAQYVIDRDGSIYQALDPDLASVHVNIFKTLPGINNDNSVGIEMCHSGSQEYTEPQVDSLIKLVVYLQAHYHVSDENVITHKYAQQGDHTDPVNFAWHRFISDKGHFQQTAVGLKVAILNNEMAAPRDIAGGVNSYSKSKSDSRGIPPAKDSLLLQAKNGFASRVSIPDSASANASKETTKIPLSLPLRGPIELDPAAVKLLEYGPALSPEKQLGDRQPKGANASVLPSSAGAPIPTGHP